MLFDSTQSSRRQQEEKDLYDGRCSDVIEQSYTCQRDISIVVIVVRYAAMSWS